MKYDGVMISVIVPCYKASAYLPLLCKDLRKQTFEDFEVLLINDGDNSQSEKIVELCSVDRRFVSYYQNNGGVSSARNLGIDNAHGDWIAFVDADDRLDENYLHNLFYAGKDSGASIVISGYQICDKINEVQSSRHLDLFTETKKLALYDILEYLAERTEYRAVWSKLYRKDLLTINNIRFNTKYSIGEDWLFNLEIYSCLKEIIIVHDAGYRYAIINDSSASLKYDNRHLEREISCIESLSKLRKKHNIEDADLKKKMELANLCFSLLKNLFCTKGHPSFSECVLIIDKQLLNNDLLMNSLINTRMMKFSNMVQKAVILSRNAWIIAILHKILYLPKNI